MAASRSAAGRLAAVVPVAPVVPVVAGAAPVAVAALPAGAVPAAGAPGAAVPAGRLALVPSVRLVGAGERELRSYFHSTALNGIATSFSPMPRKPPTPTTIASALPCRSIRTSLTSPIFSLLAP